MGDSNKGAITQADFDKFKTEIQFSFDQFKNEIRQIIGSSLLKVWFSTGGVVTIFCVVFAWIFDYKFDFTNANTNDRLSRVENAVFISSDEKILNEIRELKGQVSDLQERKRNNIEKKRFKQKRKERR